MTPWDQILQQHGRLVWQKAYRLLGNHADAADCFQDVFVSALEVAQREQVRNWPGLLVRLTTTRALDRLRSRIRRTGHRDEVEDMESFAGVQPTPLQLAESSELSQRLRQALAQLPPHQSEAFCLRYFDDLSYEQIAAEMKSTANAIGVLIHRARAKLAALLEPPAPVPR